MSSTEFHNGNGVTRTPRSLLHQPRIPTPIPIIPAIFPKVTTRFPLSSIKNSKSKASPSPFSRPSKQTKQYCLQGRGGGSYVACKKKKKKKIKKKNEEENKIVLYIRIHMYMYLCNERQEFAKAKTGEAAFQLKRKYESQAQTWPNWMNKQREKVMFEILLQKFDEKQHFKFHQYLNATQDAFLIEHNETKRDDFWSDNHDGSGRNMLGWYMMKTRAKLCPNGSFPKHYQQNWTKLVQTFGQQLAKMQLSSPESLANEVHKIEPVQK
ncbi:hypothetical protein RFI_04752 [Reticulomyxa filosa]|uniref:NADAR domain-containing protein n=1 Tax=Reticulomyxa filosa TaxID=46433 RepID=X6P2F1_RETFI|nr:hypothetical protein RFI_04752 [Reticulomyxa filosa]|eukprot:ETO32366.1 hypothetical protein RFI_04752 [Reticulomyxa filosa]